MAAPTAGFARLNRFTGPRLRQAAEVIADRARANAAWSKRIPASVRVHPSGNGTVQTVAAGGARAPMAYTFEGKPDGSPRSHPVFGHGPRAGWTWVKQTPRPFLRPAGDEAADAAADVFAKAIDDWIRASGFK